jgi:hypothetical protein
MKKRKKLTTWVIVVLAFVVLIQFIPVTRDNPPVEGNFDGSQDVERILRHACYNCHSNETSWPWYSRVAPVSWLVASDVHDAREHLNFSSWRSLTSGDRALAKKDIWEHIERGEMPPARYVIMHSEAKLSDAEKAKIRRWAAEPPSGADSAGAASPSYPEDD